ncbi:MAG: adenylate/guanylate cyclase domain-containing protein [Spirochaetaceae bacterium]|nr:adenylate/guanylate cyclase domain-containing protein [Spirochaetaceae bacterium]
MEISGQFLQSTMLVMQGICWILAFMTAFTKNLSKSRKIAIILMETSSAMLLISDLFFRTYVGTAGTFAWWAARIAKFCNHFFVGLILYSFTIYLKTLFTNEAALKKPPKRIRVSEFFVAVLFICLTISQITGFYYTFDGANNYIRHQGRVIAYIIPLIILILQLSCILQYYKRFTRRIRIPILLFTLIPLAATLVQFVVHDIPFVDTSIVGMAIVLYVFTIQEMNETVEKAHQMQIAMMEQYQKELERTVELRTSELRIANEKAERLLLNILPEDIARELTENPGRTISRKYPNVTVLFTDIVGFTKMSSTMSAEQTVRMLNKIISLFDERAEKEGIEKIKTIGDAYMAASGLTEDAANDGAEKMCRFAQGLLEDVRKFNKLFPVQIQIRIGINSGELVAGIIGKTKFIYDVWGDTVNVASRMESTGEPMRIHVSEPTYFYTKHAFDYKESAQVDVKGKGIMNTWFL